ncbi:heat shock factor isoform X2 [Rhodnius prolixus]|uniref:heat shock factor isoform X2 n=1 Tax=Rhodnius prolixus TaxID=13249 RepID=UPI003D18BD4E
MFPSPHSNPNVPAFIAKLWHMVSNAKSDDLICWNKAGTSFIIKNHARFSSELLPMYYKHNNMASFIRQLNKYGFHKVMTVDSTNSDKGDFEFVHPDFIKDCPALLVQIKRKLSMTKETEYKGDSSLVKKLLQDVQQLQAKQELFESKLAVMKNENDALWREQSILRQRHQKQQKIVNKLIQFLVTLVQQTRGLNLKRRLPLMLKDGTRPTEYFMAIKDSGRNNTPLICEVDPYEVYVDAETGIIRTVEHVPAQELSSISSTTEVCKDKLDTLATPAIKEEQLIVAVPCTTAVDDLLLEGQTATTPSLAVPLHEVSPAIVQTSNRQISVLPSATVRSSSQTASENLPPTTKKSLKRKYPSKTNKNDCLLLVPDMSSDAKVGEDAELHEDLLLAKACDSDAADVNWDCSDVCVSLPTVTSPSGSELMCPTSSTEAVQPLQDENQGGKCSTENSISNSDLSLANHDTSLVVSDLAPVMNKEDIDDHLNMVQSDLDVLKDILHSEGLSLDASTLMGLFSAEDPLSLNFPEVARNSNEDEIGGSELVAYSPSMLDMPETLNCPEEEPISQLNTPFIQFQNSPPSFPTSPSSSKRPKK